MAADEAQGPRRGEALGGTNDVALGGADVGDERSVGRGPPDALEQPFDRQHRCGQQDEIGLAHAGIELGHREVERAVVQSRPEPPRVAADADDAVGEAAKPRRFRHGAAEQADADDRQLPDHAGVFPRTARKAFTSLRFSSGVPTVIRSAVSSPKGVIGRTITPLWRSFW